MSNFVLQSNNFFLFVFRIVFNMTFVFIQNQKKIPIMGNFKLFGFGPKQMLAIGVLAVVAIIVYDQYIAPKISGVSAGNAGNQINEEGGN